MAEVSSWLHTLLNQWDAIRPSRYLHPRMQEPTWPKCHRTTVGVHWEPLGTIGKQTHKQVLGAYQQVLVPGAFRRFPQSAKVQKILRGELPFGLALQKKLGDIKTASLGNVMVKTTPRRAVTNVFRATVAVVERRVSGKCAARGCGKYLGSCARTVPRREMVKN